MNDLNGIDLTCPVCNKKEKLLEKYKYKVPDTAAKEKFFKKNYRILSCEVCKISFGQGMKQKELDNYYSYIYEDIHDKENNFKEFNSRFFSQALYYINHSTLSENIKVLEVGPNIQGILPTLKIFQKKIIYYYFDQVEIKHKFDNIIKLGDYYDPVKTQLPKIDLIWMSHTLEHIYPDDLVNIVKSYHGALNEGGKIFIEIPNDVLNKTFNYPHTLFFEKEGLTKLFEDLKFKVISISSVNSNSQTLYSSKKDITSKKEIINRSFFSKLYVFMQKYLPQSFVKKYVFKTFVLNGPKDKRPYFRMIVEKL